jgi:hypothetical protein
MFNLNVHYNIDNDVLPLTYDPTTIYNMFGFDMYNEMMRKLYQVNENFVSIISEFVRINLDMQEMKSLLYSQTDVDDLKSRMKNMEELLRLYATNQFVDSDTASISVDYSGVYPKLKFNVTSVEYDNIININMSDAYSYNFSHSGVSYPIALNFSGGMLLNLVNDNNTVDGGYVNIVLDKDLKNKQKLDIILKPNIAQYSQLLNFNMIFKLNNISSEINIFNVKTPKDLIQYDSNSSNFIYDDNFYLNENVYVNVSNVFTGLTNCDSGYTEIILNEDMFKTGNTIYVQNFYFKDNNIQNSTYGSVIDFSGVYTILNKNGISIEIDILKESICGCVLIGQPRVSYYNGVQVSLLRVSDDDSTTFDQRYNVTYKII